ncbi:hypothetical protein BO99DRAFT_412655 [Aspergillus violaceofuscus CBS 115571]|uniref:UBC core domain-containing protein n=1 Tax=Aspergillus violaceofuscus (strain CBS 115571) TaxID=1450538 RepID=A0A2V5H730_ASPV1|nr:hypothetical protein BO99DRAFT_412655 [Aspergillus violaceofuscus CBS 115571]
MVSASIRRLAADHAALHEELPPNYLFPPDDASADDLTQFTALLAGPQGTPYSQGLWRLHLKMPEDYPKSPPKATFKTRIWHPNVEELTGAVCVDTLKRDWKPTLTLKDVLITIFCLLIYPNPDSALNAASGSLLQENYEAFARQAKLMTSIHAPVPDDLKSAVAEAKLRGEDAGTMIPVEQDEPRTLRPRKGTRITSVTMKKRTTRKTSARNTPESESSTTPQTVSAAAPSLSSSQPSLPKPSLALTTDHLTHHEKDLRHQHHQEQTHPATNDEENNGDDENPSDSESSTNASKENDPSLSPSPVRHRPPPTLRKNIHGKRPLSVLILPMDMDDDDGEDDQSNPDPELTPNPSASDQNIAANQTRSTSPSSSPTLSYYKHHHNNKTHPLPTRDRDRERDHSPSSPEQPRNKSPKLSIPKRGASPMKGVNASGRIRDDVVASTPTVAAAATAAAAATIDLQIFEDPSSSPGSDDEETRRRRSGDGKENPLSKDFLASASSTLSPGKSSHQYPPLSVLEPSTTAVTPTTGTMSSRRAVSASVPSSSKPLRSMTLGARKVSASAGGTGKKVKPRIGIRRL